MVYILDYLQKTASIENLLLKENFPIRLGLIKIIRSVCYNFIEGFNNYKF